MGVRQGPPPLVGEELTHGGQAGSEQQLLVPLAVPAPRPFSGGAKVEGGAGLGFSF